MNDNVSIKATIASKMTHGEAGHELVTELTMPGHSKG